MGLCTHRRHHTGKIPRGAGQGLHLPDWHFSRSRPCASRGGLRLLAHAQTLDRRCALRSSFADIAFIAASRTALLVAPLLVIALGYRQFGLKGAVAAAVIAGALTGALCLNPLICARASSIRWRTCAGISTPTPPPRPGSISNSCKSRGGSSARLPSSATVPARSRKNSAAPRSAKPALPARHQSIRTIRFSPWRSSSGSRRGRAAGDVGRAFRCSAATGSSPGSA